ncbi:unnamed protein product [Schistosoma margrebowiei]|uniref:Uncharacterized protein n=1 Tax=Schistosoma margrebowiei TaxID=48269 RepID=A0A183MTS5_9TREM|nr:unnamed protein product [Schistosoma margrebowiei]
MFYSCFCNHSLTCGHLPVGSSWLYLGTDKGNVNFISVQRFTTSGYVINWNKAIDLSQSSHPGKVIQIAENPQDSNKILIGYSSGFLVLWDLKTKQGDARFKHTDIPDSDSLLTPMYCLKYLEKLVALEPEKLLLHIFDQLSFRETRFLTRHSKVSEFANLDIRLSSSLLGNKMLRVNINKDRILIHLHTSLLKGYAKLFNK